MPYFKNSANNVFWLDDNDSQEVWAKPDWIEISEDEAKALLAEKMPAPDYSAMRASAYKEESDPLFFKAQRGEASMDDWRAKVAEIKARWPQ